MTTPIRNASWLTVLAVAALFKVSAVLMVWGFGDLQEWTSWTLDPDSHGYLAFSRDISDGTQDSVSTRTPAYPVFLALTSPEPGESALAPVLLQQLSDLATALLIGLMVPAACGKPWLASAYYLLLPASFITSVRILPDTLLALMTAAGGFLWLRAAAVRDPRKLIGLYALIGVTCAVGTLIKPVYMFAPLVYTVLVFATGKRPLIDRILSILVLLAVHSAGPQFLLHHNREAFGLDSISAQDGYEQAGRIWVLSGRATQLEFVTEVKDSVNALSMRNGRVDYGVRSAIYREMALEGFRSDPWAVILPHISSWPRFFSTGVGNTLRYLGLPRDGWYAGPLKILSAILVLLMPAGFVTGLAVPSIRRRTGPLLCLASVWFAVMVPVHGPLAGPRYGLTFFPVMAAAAISSLCMAAVLFARRSRPGSVAP